MRLVAERLDPGKLAGMRPAIALHVHLHLHLHENAEVWAKRARQARRMTDSPAYRQACREADVRYYHDLVAQARATDDEHLRSALLRLAKRVRDEINDSLDARRVIDACALAVERASARQMRQARSNGEAPRLKVGWAKAK
jgi:hypothetical protein